MVIDPTMTLPDAEDRTVVDALRTSSSETTSLPLADRWDPDATKPTSTQLALPQSSPVPQSNHDDYGLGGILVDSDDDRVGVDVIALPPPPRVNDPFLESMVIFKVVHVRPGRMKRPLQSQDDIGSQDIAFRKYKLLERDMTKPEVMRIRVTRAEGHDVFLSCDWRLFHRFRFENMCVSSRYV